MHTKRAFTLAEVLVTLMLIGVVAVLTIPFMVQEFQKSRWTVTFKRTFAETYNALGKVALEEDCSKSLTCTHLFDGSKEESTQLFGEAFAKMMALSQNCKMNKDENCFSHKIKIGLTDGTEQTVEETMTEGTGKGDDAARAAISYDGNFYTFRTTRGVSYALFSFGTQCLNTDTGNRNDYIKFYVYDEEDSNNQMLSLCGFIVVDVNGDQKPNIWGRDVFGMWVTDRSVIGIYPFGGEYDRQFRESCSTNPAGDTRGCAAQLINDGWVMKY